MHERALVLAEQHAVFGAKGRVPACHLETGKLLAVGERTVSHARQALAYVYLRQGGAAFERIASNVRHIVRNGHFRKGGTDVEGIFADGGHAATYGHLCKCGAVLERSVTNGSHPVGNSDMCEGGTFVERPVPYVGHAPGNVCLRKGGAFAESTLSYACNAVRKGYLRECGAFAEGFPSYAGYLIFHFVVGYGSRNDQHARKGAVIAAGGFCFIGHLYRFGGFIGNVEIQVCALEALCPHAHYREQDKSDGKNGSPHIDCRYCLHVQSYLVCS